MTSVIIATKDLIKCGRGIDRLYYQVLSLRQQSEEVEIILVDGSGFPEHKRITQRLYGMGVRMIHAEQSVIEPSEAMEPGNKGGSRPMDTHFRCGLPLCSYFHGSHQRSQE
jgi:hypothetical protein